MKAFLACSAKSRVVEKVEDIDHGWDALSDTNKAFIRSIIDLSLIHISEPTRPY